MTDRPPRPYAVVPASLEGAPGAALHGEIDIDAVPTVEIELDALVHAGAGVFVLDLCDVEFFDSSGLRLLLHVRALLAREDRELAVICPPGPVRRLFDMTGTAELLILFDSRDEAAASVVRRG